MKLLLTTLVVVLGVILSANGNPRKSGQIRPGEEDAVKIEEIDHDAKDPPDSYAHGANGTEPPQGVVPQARVSYAGYQLWNVILDTSEKRKTLIDLRQKQDISNWGGNRTAVDILVKPSAIDKVARIFVRKNIHYEVLLDNMQTAIDEENPPLSEEEEELANRKGHRMTWQAYHRLQDIYDYLNFLASTYPQLCTVRNIGTTVEGRSMQLLKISNGQPNNAAVWVDGGIHAREWITPATVTYFINHLVENYERESKDMQNIDWYILPVANPDGYEHSHVVDRLWRKNRARHPPCIGTDLNRNFGYRWGGKGSGTNPCGETYGGRGPFSEPETRNIRNFITSTKANWKAYISFHSYGQYILHPWGYDQVLPPDHKELYAVGTQMAHAMRKVGGETYQVGSAAILLYPAAGGSDDWAKGTAGFKYAYTVELRDKGRYGFVLPASFINPTAREALESIRVIASVANKA